MKTTLTVNPHAFLLYALGAWFSTTFSSPALAGDSTVCKQGTVERTVEVTYTDPGKKVPCEVKYTKEGGSEPEVLWHAQFEEGYCEDKATSFVEKLKGFGWNCDGESATAAKQEG